MIILKSNSIIFPAEATTMADFGYAGSILILDISDGRTREFNTSDYARRFIGGRGMAAKLYWDLASPEVKVFDPQNPLIFTTGPVAGFNRFAGNRWQVCSKTPLMEPEMFSYANLGERWGTLLKSAGYDALVITGKTEKPSYIYINNSSVEIRNASHLWGMKTFECTDAIKNELNSGSDVSVLAIGPAGENLVPFATMITDDCASGAGGMASVMGSKNIKAIAVSGDRKPAAAHPDKLNELAKEILDTRKNIWADYFIDIPGKTKLKTCRGCGIGCWRKTYSHEGRKYKFFCQAGAFYIPPAMKYKPDSMDTVLFATRMCDHYGLDTTVLYPVVVWLTLCRDEGILNEKNTDLPLSKIGSTKFIEKLVKDISFRNGFGEVIAEGLIKATEKTGKQSCDLMHQIVLTRGNEIRDYDPRLIITNALLYATEPRRPINEVHELTHAMEFYLNWKKGKDVPFSFITYDDLLNMSRLFWGGEAAADFTTYEGKALASKIIQDRVHAKESMILCDFIWPIIYRRYGDDRSGIPDMESKVLSAITGRNMDHEGLVKTGERIFNMQRAVMLLHGWKGRDDDILLDYLHDEPLEYVPRFSDCDVPGKKGEIASRKGAKLERNDFENLKSEYYELRGWDADTGYPTAKKLAELDLTDIADSLKLKGLCR